MKEVFFYTAVFFSFFSILVCNAEQIHYVSNELTAAHLSVYKSAESARQTFAFNGKNIQFKDTPATLFSAWVGYDIKPSKENTVTFQLKSLDSAAVEFKALMYITYYHASNADRCKGRAPKKNIVRKFTAQAHGESAVLGFPVTEADLRCTQCGKQLNFGSFLFYISQESKGKVEITVPIVKSAFALRIQRSRDKQSAYLKNVLSPDYKPYEMDLPAQSRLSRNVLSISEKSMNIRRNLDEFRIVMDLYKQKKYQQAVSEAEKIAENNKLAQMMLYLVYSRSYDGIAVDYTKAANFFSMLLGSYDGREPGFMFYLHEYKNIWKLFRLMPTFPGEKVTVIAWGDNGMAMQEVVPLRGKYPLKECYEEKMRNIGGVIPRTLYMFARENMALSAMLAEARKLGNAEAWAGKFAPFEARALKPLRTPLSKESINIIEKEEFANLQHAADLGYIPAKLIIARQLLDPAYKAENAVVKARKLLIESIEECRKYSKTLCKHALTDLQYAEDLLAIIPDSKSSTADLLARYDKAMSNLNYYNTFSKLQQHILALELAKRFDTPESLYFQALFLPAKEKENALRMAAGRGSIYALRVCLQIVNSNDPDYWYFCYLAGKNKLPYNRSFQNYFNEAYKLLKECRWKLPPEQYKKNLELLAPYHPAAKEELQSLSRKLDFIINCSDNQSMSARLINDGGRYMLKIKAEPSEKKRCVTFKRTVKEALPGSIFLFTASRERSNYDISCEFTDEKNTLIKTYPGNFVPMNFIPQEMTLTLAPRKTPLDLQINIMVRP